MPQTIVDHDPWSRPDALASQLGGDDALADAISAGTVELHIVDGLRLVRRVWTRDRPRGGRWMSYEAAELEIGIGRRAIDYRVQRGAMDRRLIRDDAGVLGWQVRRKR